MPLLQSKLELSLAAGNRHLLADVELCEVAVAMAAWRWFLGDSWSPMAVSAAGDVFVCNPAEVVAQLDTGAGTLNEIAATQSAFEAALKNSDVVEAWFQETVVAALLASGVSLKRGQCYGYGILPVFAEGSYEASNRRVLSVTDHLRITGIMHLELVHVADGERVRLNVRD